MSSAAAIKELKASLAKKLPCDNLSPEAVEKCRDLLERLDECKMTLELLTETLIGTVVSKFKAHPELGPAAKALVKKWKKLAKEGGARQTSSNNEKKAAVTKNGAVAKKSAVRQKPTTLERRDSTRSAASMPGPQEEWADLAPLRQNICNKLFESLQVSKAQMIESGFNENAVTQLCVARASEVEDAMQSLLGNNRQGYTQKARSLCFNLKQNGTLREEVMMGSTEAKELVRMSSEQLVPAEKAAKRADMVKKVQESRRLDWEQANEKKINEQCGIKGDLLKASLFTCGRCKSIKTTSTQKQTRSADEPMTVFVLCMNCGNRWKC